MSLQQIIEHRTRCILGHRGYIQAATVELAPYQAPKLEASENVIVAAARSWADRTVKANPRMPRHKVDPMFITLQASDKARQSR